MASALKSLPHEQIGGGGSRGWNFGPATAMENQQATPVALRSVQIVAKLLETMVHHGIYVTFLPMYTQEAERIWAWIRPSGDMEQVRGRACMYIVRRLTWELSLSATASRRTSIHCWP